MNGVVTGAAVKYVITGIVVDGVVAVSCIDGVRRGIAIQGVVARRGGEHLGLDRGHVPHRAIGELEVLHHIARGAIGVEVELHAQAVIAAVQADDQVVGLAGKGHARGGDAYTQQDGVGIGAGHFSVVVGDGVLA